MSKCIPRVFLIVLFVNLPKLTIGQDVQFYYNKAKEAYTQKNYESYYNNIKQAHKLHPYQQFILYHFGIASALTNHKEDALKFLREATYIKADLDLQISDLQGIKATPGYQDLLDLQLKISRPIVTSQTAFTVPEKAAHMESVTYDKVSNSHFLGAIHKRKITRRSNDGTLSNFTEPGEHGLTSVFGLKVDTKKRILWACSSPMPEMENYDSLSQSGVFQFDLKTNKLTRKFETSDKSIQCIFGDLVLSNKGEVFVSDSKNNIIFKVNETTGTLDQFFTSEEFWNIQGITFSDDGQYLFISDYIKGPYRLSIKTLELIKLDVPFEQSLKGIDGLTFYKNSLIAIQNGVTPARVSRYYLNKGMNTLTKIEILDRAHPSFNEPTTGTVDGSSFYYVANSPWGFYDDNHQLIEDKIQDLVILKIDLK